MKKRIFLMLVFLGIAFTLSACKNRYHNQTYEMSDSYGEIFEGQYVPQDVH